MMRGLDLFSGIGGISLALKPWVQTVAYCECEPYAQAVLLERMQSNDLDSAPIWDDVRTLNREILDTEVDIIFGGFPCQDISAAGKQLGIKSDTRSGLFFHIMRLVREFNPRYIFLENVAAICSNGLDTVLREIASAGYDAQWCCVSAAEVGAPHKRDRWWLLGYSNSSRWKWTGQAQSEKRYCDSVSTWTGENVADTYRAGLEVRKSCQDGDECEATIGSGWTWPARRNQSQFDWEPSRTMADTYREQTGRVTDARCESRKRVAKPGVGRTTNGLPYRVDRIKALGNSVVPQAAREAFKMLIGETRQ